MTARFLSLIDPPPSGFSSSKTFGKRELLADRIVLLTPSCAQALALLDDFANRVEGILLTEGDAPPQRLGPLLWQFSLPPEAISPENKSLVLALELLSAAAACRNHALIGEYRVKHLSDELETCRHDYTTMRSSLYDQLTRLIASEKKQRLAASVFENSYEGILIADEQSQIVDVNPAFTRITGYERHEVIGQSAIRFLYSGKEPEQLDLNIRKWLETQAFWRREVQNCRKDNEAFPAILSVTAMRDADGELCNYIAIFSDISQIKKQESEIHRISYHDSLTGLPNRRLLLERMTMAINENRRFGKLLTVVSLDLDGFKKINDRYGKIKGDAVLVEIAAQIKRAMRTDDLLARLGGDEFSMLFTGQDKQEDSQMALERLLQAISKPVLIDGELIALTGSLGATIFPLDDADPETLIRHADQAMFQAKKSGGNCYQLFDTENERQSQHNRDTQARLRQALQKNEFELYFQPKIDLSTGKVIGAEALIRWNHPQNGILPPNAFLHYIEGNLRNALGEWVIDNALTQMGTWQAQGLYLPVSVNIDAQHLLQNNFSDRLADMLAAHAALSPEIHLEMEILETAALTDTQQAVSTIERCRQQGIRFSLDDFGTGYSSLTYLRSLPVDTLKIDQSFVRDMLEDKDDMGIVESIIRLGKAFNCQVIAEGMETPEHGVALLQLGCTLAQGYGIARPMPAGQIRDWIGQWNERLAQNKSPEKAGLAAIYGTPP